MDHARCVDQYRKTAIACTLVLTAGCGSSSGGSGTGSTGTTSSTSTGGSTTPTSATVAGGTSAGTSVASSNGGVITQSTGSKAAGGANPTTGVGGTSVGGTSGATTAKAATGGTSTAAGGTTAQATTKAGTGGSGLGGNTTGQEGGNVSTGGSGGGAGGAAGGSGTALVSGCVGNAWPTADPSVAGPFAVTADKNVGPLAGVVPDPVYGTTQQKFNVYRPKDLTQGGYCHPILVWANGHTDNPEPNPPLCVTGNGQYCGSYLMLMNQLASHGFVVIASLSTITSQGNPLPTVVGLDWLIQQAEDSTSPYYHRLDTAHIGALGHSEGGFSTSKAASDPRITATATVSGAAINTGIHGPSLWFCGGKDTVVSCDSVKNVYSAITTQPAILVDNLAADHGGWLYQNGAKGPDIFGFTAWFRVHLMGDTANRKMFYGPSCTLCTDSRVQVTQNSLMAQ